MRTHEEHQSAASELREVESLLEGLSQNRLLERMSLERRAENLRAEIGEVEPARLRKRLKLTFRGRPVVGSEGFYSDFASKATGKLTESVQAISAGIHRQLNYMGPIPGATDARLLITGTARGSFGFEFEVPESEQMDIQLSGEPVELNGQNQTEMAIDTLRRLLETASQPDNDDALAEIIDEVHPRSVKKVKEFLDVLHDSGALCAMEFGGQKFRLNNAGQLERSRERLDDSNIHEERQVFDGEIQGVLPKSRTFEFKVAGQDLVIRAKISNAIDDPDVLNRAYLYKPSKVTLHITQVGQGRPRYVLQSLSDISDSNLLG